MLREGGLTGRAAVAALGFRVRNFSRPLRHEISADQTLAHPATIVLTLDFLTIAMGFDRKQNLRPRKSEQIEREHVCNLQLHRSPSGNLLAYL